MRWAPPLFPNGEVVHYTIYYNSSPSDTPLSVILGGGVMSHDLEGLLPFTTYTILVSANTSAGEGPAGPDGGVVVTTHQDGKDKDFVHL